MSVAVAMVGREGMIGLSIALGVSRSFQSVQVQGAGSALRMRSTAFSDYCAADRSLRARFNRYVWVAMGECERMVHCVHYHVVEARLARWLLMTRDRSGGDRFHLTQESVAGALGVQREAVTHAASSLKGRGLIQYSRGEVTILDAGQLGESSCACYEHSRAALVQPADRGQHAPRVARAENEVLSSIAWEADSTSH